MTRMLAKTSDPCSGEGGKEQLVDIKGHELPESRETFRDI